jgi:hypothetical protein
MMIDSNQSSWFYHVIYMITPKFGMFPTGGLLAPGEFGMFSTGVLQAPDWSVELACGMLQHLSI